MTVMEDERSPTAWDSQLPQGLHSHSLSDSNCESVNRVTFLAASDLQLLAINRFCPLTPTGVVEAWYYHWPNIKYCLLQNGILEWKFNPYGQNQRSCRIYQSKHNFVWKNENHIGNRKSTTCLGEEGWGWMGRQGVTRDGKGPIGKTWGSKGKARGSIG